MKIVMVCGVARSGSSMMCGVLNAMGVHFHETEFNDVHATLNPKGHFETYEMIDIMQPCQRFLKPIIQSGRVPCSTTINKHVEITKPRLMALVDRVAEGREYWGFKCLTKYTIDVFCEVFKPDFHIVCISRSLVDQAFGYQNLVKKLHPGKPFSFNQSLTDVNESVCNMFSILSRVDTPVTFTSFEKMRSQPLVESARIAADIGIELTEDMRVRIKEFVEPRLSTWVVGGRDAEYKLRGLK